MSFYMVTWDGDLTQFLVEAECETDAIEKAVKSNSIFDKEEFGERDEKDEEDKQLLKDMADKNLYTVDAINLDIDMLQEIMKRNDRIGKYGDAIVFND